MEAVVGREGSKSTRARQLEGPGTHCLGVISGCVSAVSQQSVLKGSASDVVCSSGLSSCLSSRWHCGKRNVTALAARRPWRAFQNGSPGKAQSVHPTQHTPAPKPLLSRTRPTLDTRIPAARESQPARTPVRFIIKAVARRSSATATTTSCTSPSPPLPSHRSRPAHRRSRLAPPRCPPSPPSVLLPLWNP